MHYSSLKCPLLVQGGQWTRCACRALLVQGGQLTRCACALVIAVCLQVCAETGGALMSIHSENELNDLRLYLTARLYKPVWLGLTDRQHEGKPVLFSLTDRRHEGKPI